MTCNDIVSRCNAFTLDYGKCPKWLFERMVRLGREITRVLIEEYGPPRVYKKNPLVNRFFSY